MAVYVCAGNEFVTYPLKGPVWQVTSVPVLRIRRPCGIKAEIFIRNQTLFEVALSLLPDHPANPRALERQLGDQFRFSISAPLGQNLTSAFLSHQLSWV